MFTRAVKDYEPTGPPAPKVGPAFAQTLLPSSNPMAAKSPQAKAQQDHALQSSSFSHLNQLRPSTYAKQTNSSKRTVSDLDERSSNGWETTVKHNSTGPSQVSSGSSTGLLGKLHRAVDFDENDFVDDEEIDLDIDEPVLPSVEQKVTYPTLPTPELPVCAQGPPPSTAPIAWSSSPPHHKRTPPNASLLKRDFTTSTKAAEEAESDEKVLENVRAHKRRVLPWLNEENLQTRVEDAQLQAPQRRNQAQEKDPNTPFSKGKKDALPWNRTGSAFKQEQRKHRQQANQGKKLIKDIEETGGKKTRTKSGNKKIPKLYLSEEQKQVLNLVVHGGKSVFFTGSAGTGKSVLMREIIAELRKKHKAEPDRVAVTASTGLAACNVGGVTLHSFSGIGLGKENAELLIKKIKKNAKAKIRWMRTKVLIVDEISMVDGELFDKLEKIARNLRNSGRPFGGIQLVVTGDFFQLPPVPDNGRVAKFAFDAETWSTSVKHTIGLTQVFRQKDPVFAGMLNEMRVGTLTNESITAFHKLRRPLVLKDVEATELFPTRHEVDNANNSRLSQLGGRHAEFRATDSGTITDVEQRTRLLANCMAPALISLKKGAQVMLIKNFDETLVNGSIGKVQCFATEETFNLYRKEGSDGDLDSSPIATMDISEDTSESRARIRSMMNQDTQPANTAPRWPVVEFKLANGAPKQMLCMPETWKIELPNGEVQAQRVQLPLILAWALSIHKAQGQTLELVKVDLGKIFERGQAYVALSRATSQEGLQISRFDPRKVLVHEKVKAFYNSLYSAGRAVGSTEVSGPGAGKSGRKAAGDGGALMAAGEQDFEDTYWNELHG